MADSDPLLEESNRAHQGTSQSANKKAPFWLVTLGLIVVQVGFGAYGVILKKYGPDVNATVFSMLRDAFCCPVLFTAAILVEKKFVWPQKSEIPLFVGLGLTGMLGNQLLYILGVFNTTPTIASIYQPAIPVWTALFSILFQVESIPPFNKLRGWTKVGGILLATGGAGLIIAFKDSGHTHQKNPLLGNICLIGNTTCMGLYVVLQKKYVFKAKQRLSKYPVHLTAWTYFFGAIFMMFASLYYVGRNETHVFSITHEFIIPLVFAVFVSSSLCYGLLTWANQQTSATVVTSFWPLQVFVAAILSYYVLSTKLDVYQAIGGVLIVFGLFSVLYSNRLEEKEALADGLAESEKKAVN